MAINIYNESPLHAALKRWYASDSARFEVPLQGFVIDIVEGELLVEIQTRNFSKMRPKLESLLASHPLRLVYPVPRETWIVRQEGERVLSRRKSPKRGTLEELFSELVYIPQLLAHANFTLDVLDTQMEEVREVTKRRRKGWQRVERRLIAVLGRRLFHTPNDLATLLPQTLQPQFTTRDLAEARGVRVAVAQKMAYCFKAMELIHPVGHRRRSILYERR